MRISLPDECAKRELTKIVRGLYAHSSAEEMGRMLSHELPRIIGHDSMIFCDGDKTSGHSVYHIQTVGDAFTDYAEPMARHLTQLPFIPHYIAHPNGRAMRTYDLVERDDMHRRNIYDEVFRHIGLEEQLGADIPSSPGLLRGLILNRSKAGFSDRDVEIFDLIRPHVVSAMAISEQWGRLDHAATNGGCRASILLNSDGRVAMRSPRAGTLLEDFCGHFTGALPAEVEKWVRQETAFFRSGMFWASPRRSMRLGGPDTTLHLRLAGTPESGCMLLLLEEYSHTPAIPDSIRRLSPREREVLDWIASGKSNMEIAEIIGISRHTVKNHVKHILAALGVDNRTSAATMHLRRCESELL